MAQTDKLGEILDGMVEHVRYEVSGIIYFTQFGNNWCGDSAPV